MLNIISHSGNANENHKEVSLHTFKWLICKSVDKDLEELELSYTVGGNMKWKKGWQFLKKLNIYLLNDLAILSLGIYLRKMKVTFTQKTCARMLLSAFFGIAKIWRQSNVHQ